MCARSRQAEKQLPAGQKHDSPALKMRRIVLRTLLPAAIILGLGTFAYSTSFDGAFLLDDQAHILGSEAVHDFDVTHMRRDRLLSDITLAMNWQASTRDTRSYHVVNLVIHLAAGLMLFALVRRILRSPRLAERFGRHADILSAIVSAIWVCHPLTTQAVTYIIQRDESLMGLMYLLTMYCVARAGTAPRPVYWRVGAIVACAAGMMCKQVMATAPMVALAMDWLLFSPSLKLAIRRGWWMYAAMVVAIAWPVVALVSLPSARAAGLESTQYTRWEYAATQLGVIVHYLRLSILPYDLSFDYGWGKPENIWQIVLPGALVAALLGLSITLLSRRRPAALAGVWFFAILAPTSSILPLADAAFEQRMYLPLCAIVVLAVAGGYWLLELVAEKLRGRKRRDHGTRADAPRAVLPAALAVACIVTVVLACATRERNRVYGSAESVWADVISKYPEDARAHNNLGRVLAEKGQLDKAMSEYRLAMKYRPDYAQPHCNMGAALEAKGEFAQAIAEYQKAIAIQKPEPFPDAHYNWGNALVEMSRREGNEIARNELLDQAIAQYQAAVHEQPRGGAYRLRLAAILASRGRDDAAIEQYRAALELGAETADLQYNLAVLLQRKGDLDGAIRHMRRAVELSPQDPSYRQGLATLLQNQAAPGN